MQVAIKTDIRTIGRKTVGYRSLGYKQDTFQKRWGLSTKLESDRLTLSLKKSQGPGIGDFLGGRAEGGHSEETIA